MGTVDAATLAQLKAMKGAFQAAKDNPITTQDRAFVTYPDGKYRMACGGVTIANSQAGNLQMVWDWTIIEGQYAGKPRPEYMVLNDPDKLPYVLRRIRQCGISLDTLEIEDLPEVCDTISKMRIIGDVTLKMGKNKDGSASDFQNFYLNAVEQQEATGTGTTTEKEAERPGDHDKGDDPPASANTGWKVSDRVKFEVDGESKVGLIKNIDAANGIFTIRSGGKEYNMEDGDFTAA